MDPDANLETMLDLARSVLELADREPEHVPDDAAELASYVLALDEWLRGGAALPKDWQPYGLRG